MLHSTTPAFSPAASLLWEETGPGVRRSLVAYNDDLLLVKVAFEAGAVGALHQHVHSQITYVESGEFAVTVGDETWVLRAGDSFYAAPNVPHGVVARQAGALLDSFSPLRLDFLPAAPTPAQRTFATAVSHPTAAPNANAGGEESPGSAGHPAS